MSKSKTKEALILAKEIIKGIENDELRVNQILLKYKRFLELLNLAINDTEFSKIGPNVTELESHIYISEKELNHPMPNTVNISGQEIDFSGFRRTSLTNNITRNKKQLRAIKNYIHNEVNKIYMQLEFGLGAQTIFERYREKTDSLIARKMPTVTPKLDAIQENLNSKNPEHWANAVNTCRRILKIVADRLYPPNPNGKEKIVKGDKEISVGPENYINRLVLYVEENASSKKYCQIVGSHLKFLGDRLDAINEASCKGTHSEINDKEEAERYIIYTYLLLGDILMLAE